MNIHKHPMKDKYTYKFIVPSLIGITLFMFPITHNGEITIPIAILSKYIQNSIAPIAHYLVISIVLVSALTSLASRVFRPTFVLQSPYLKALFHPSTLWFSIRLVSAVLVILVQYELGPEYIWSEATGGLIMQSLIPVLISVFILAGMFLPLLLNFGLLEFVGVMLTRVMRPLFKLPGRASIDCVASWLGDGTIGVLLTSKQYEQGFYTEKEASIIGTAFSAVSITFSLVVIETVGLGHLFIPFYLTVAFAGLVAAIVTSRIPPLSRKKDQYYNNSKGDISERIPSNYNMLSWGLKQASERAKANTSIGSVVKEGVQNVADMWLGVIPIVISVGTFALIVAEQTPVFEWLGYPFIPLLELLQIPEAEDASQTIFIGFADMFIPSIMASASIESPITLFIIAALSVTQLIYMAEVGSLLLGSKIPVSISDLVIIFLERTLITLPIIAGIAHLIF